MERNFKYLINNKIIWRQNPTEEPTSIHDWGWYYKDGTYTSYELFQTKVKINTYKALYWHLKVLWYLNPDLSQNKFEKLAAYIADISKGFVIFEISSYTLDKIIYDVSMSDLDRPPPNRLRKVIFYDNCGLTKSEKCSIASTFCKKSVSESDIYETMLYMFDMSVVITNKSLAEYLKVSPRTIQRRWTDSLRREKDSLNAMLNEKVQH